MASPANSSGLWFEQQHSRLLSQEKPVVRLTDLHEAGQQSLLGLDCPTFDDTPFVEPKPLNERNVTLISTAGLIARGEAPFRGGDSTYRTFSTDNAREDIIVSHISVNFDRITALRDIELMFPRETLAAMANDKEINSAASEHYSFLGSTDPVTMEDSAAILARSLHERNIDTAVLLPV